MPLQSSGAIDFSDINVELGVAANTQRSLGDANSRGLAGIASGAIRLGTDFYGKSNAPPSVYYMVVGGGGGGGPNAGGGGGGGSIRTNVPSPFSGPTINPAATVLPRSSGLSFNIGIGGGGSSGRGTPVPPAVPSGSGGNSTISGPFGTFTGIGGGGGGGDPPAAAGGKSGGCGGGGRYWNAGGGASGNQGVAVTQGFAGGPGRAPGQPNSSGGGGGGILGAGGVISAGGGATWMNIQACGGGANGAQATEAVGPTGGGGTGGFGGRGTRGGIAGSGGPGVAIIGYPGPQAATGGSVTTSGPMVYHVFTAAGTFTWN